MKTLEGCWGSLGWEHRPSWGLWAGAAQWSAAATQLQRAEQVTAGSPGPQPQPALFDLLLPLLPLEGFKKQIPDIMSSAVDTRECPSLEDKGSLLQVP